MEGGPHPGDAHSCFSHKLLCTSRVSHGPGRATQRPQGCTGLCFRPRFPEHQEEGAPCTELCVAKNVSPPTHTAEQPGSWQDLLNQPQCITLRGAQRRGGNARRCDCTSRGTAHWPWLCWEHTWRAAQHPSCTPIHSARPHLRPGSALAVG